MLFTVPITISLPYTTVQEALFRHLEMSQRGFATVQGNLHLYFSAIARSSPFNTENYVLISFI